MLSIARIEPQVAGIRYFGDLDETGLRIPANAGMLAESVGLPPIRPATGLYGAMLRRGVGQPGQRRPTAEAVTALTSWLDPEHRGKAAELMLAGERLAQESVGLSYLSSSSDWLGTLQLLVPRWIRGQCSSESLGYSLRATSGPVSRVSSGKVAAMMPRQTTMPAPVMT